MGRKCIGFALIGAVILNHDRLDFIITFLAIKWLAFIDLCAIKIFEGKSHRKMRDYGKNTCDPISVIEFSTILYLR